jgi:hypothetical protein
MTSGVNSGLLVGRSVGVTVSAVVVFVGSAFTILCGAALVLGSLATLHSREALGAAANIPLVLAVEAVFFFGFGGWGVASGVGLLKTKEWGRISLLVYAVMLVFFSVVGAAAMAVVPFPEDMASDPNLPANFIVMLRVGFVLFFAVFAALGGFWIYFFNTRDVKAQFLALQPVMGYTATGAYAGIPGGGVGVVQRARPLSITIIAWYLLGTSALAALFFAVRGVRHPGVGIPMWFLGFALYGRLGASAFVTLTVAHAVGAIGLLRTKMWGLYTTIGTQWLAAMNIVLVVAVPANRAKFAQMVEAASSSHSHLQAPLMYPAWIGMAVTLPITVVILWFLITGREGVVAAQKGPA